MAVYTKFQKNNIEEILSNYKISDKKERYDVLENNILEVKKYILEKVAWKLN